MLTVFVAARGQRVGLSTAFSQRMNPRRRHLLENGARGQLFAFRPTCKCPHRPAGRRPLRQRRPYFHSRRRVFRRHLRRRRLTSRFRVTPSPWSLSTIRRLRRRRCRRSTGKGQAMLPTRRQPPATARRGRSRYLFLWFSPPLQQHNHSQPRLTWRSTSVQHVWTRWRPRRCSSSRVFIPFARPAPRRSKTAASAPTESTRTSLVASHLR